MLKPENDQVNQLVKTGRAYCKNAQNTATSQKCTLKEKFREKVFWSVLRQFFIIMVIYESVQFTLFQKHGVSVQIISSKALDFKWLYDLFGIM